MAVYLTRIAAALGLVAALSGALAGEGRAQGTAAAPHAPREPISTDRPDFTDSPDVVAPRTVQLEAGDSYGRDGGARSNAIGELLVRVGLSRRLELRLEPGSYKRSDDGSGAHRGWDDAAVGFKLALREAPEGEGGGGHAPALGLEARTTLPVGLASAAEPEAKLAASWELGARWSVATNLDYALRAGDAGDAGGGRAGEVAASVSFERELGARLHGYAEGYAIHQAGAAGTQFLDTGLTLLLGPDVQLDARVGTGVGANHRDYYVGVGLARRW